MPLSVPGRLRERPPVRVTYRRRQTYRGACRLFSGHGCLQVHRGWRGSVVPKQAVEVAGSHEALEEEREREIRATSRARLSRCHLAQQAMADWSGTDRE